MATKKKKKAAARVRRVPSPREILAAITPERVQDTARTVAPRHLALVLAEAPAIERAFVRAPLAKVKDEARAGLRLLSDFAAGTYGDVPYQAVSILVFAYRYVLHDEDLIPERMGTTMSRIDDRRVFQLSLDLVKSELEAHEKWRSKKD